MTREEYNAELEKYQQMEAEKDKLEREKSKAHERFYASGNKNLLRTSEENDDKLLEKHPELGAQSWSSASIDYVSKKKKLIKLDAKMEQSRKRLANYEGE